MADDPVNLNRFRKRKAREQRESEAERNRAAHGTTRADREREAQERQRREAAMEGHRRSAPEVPELRGERLVLRGWRDADLATFAALNAHPEVTRHLPGPLTREQSDAFAARIRAHFALHGFGLWAVEVPGVADFAGFVANELERREAQLSLMHGRLLRSNEDLARSNCELDDFAYVASHDLKEPLRGMANYAHFLLEDYGKQLDDDGRDKLEALPRLANRMSGLLDELLHYSRVGRTELAVEPVDLNALVSGVLESMRASLHAANATICVGSLPTLRCNATLAAEVFSNLIGNAVKYNDREAKRVDVGAALTATGHVLFVRDDGIGIPERHRDAIFTIFKRLHPRDAYGGGSGAGLTIVKKVVERHGGWIRLRSEPERGTTFFFTLEPGIAPGSFPGDAESR